MKIFHEDPAFDAQLQRTLIGAYSGTADLGEAFAVASRVPVGDHDTWYDEWTAVATKAREVGSVAESRGRRDLAVSSYLRSAEYHRQSFYFLRDDLNDPRVHAGYRAQREAFRAAMRLLLWPGDPIQLNNKPVHSPTNGSGNGSSNGHRYAPPLLEGYVFRPSDDDVPRPTIMFPCSVDSTSEEGWKYGARAAVDLGFNAVTFAGPGQGELLFVHRIGIREDFEAVVTPLVNWLVGEPYVDPAGLVLLGRGVGGLLATRAAAYEHRLAALVADSSPFEHEEISLAAHAPLVTCPTLVTEGEGDPAGRSGQLYDILTCEKEMKLFTQEQGAGGSCEGMGQQIWQDYVFNWVLDVTNRRD